MQRQAAANSPLLSVQASNGVLYSVPADWAGIIDQRYVVHCNGPQFIALAAHAARLAF